MATLEEVAVGVTDEVAGGVVGVSPSAGVAALVEMAAGDGSRAFE